MIIDIQDEALFLAVQRFIEYYPNHDPEKNRGSKLVNLELDNCAMLEMFIFTFLGIKKDIYISNEKGFDSQKCILMLTKRLKENSHCLNNELPHVEYYHVKK